MRRYYFPIFHNGETQADEVGELFGSAELAVQYGACVARDIASDPEYDPGAGTVVIVLDDSGAEIERQRPQLMRIDSRTRRKPSGGLGRVSRTLNGMRG
ncbi:hypothetical protein M2189_007624 [Bradyrhizobium japonicum]|uniref:DUF6894 family protein n=1 Tax=Bradyrhizobium japonicum TaxID=375 RepID=UPI0021670858|nr:hypothetical protein [Bradyrhizobium japonicum]MCS3502863.1 hypothetical protein [Bradyrhizobium japonicum]MCS3964421.1 hypothetical protein [Bradyrhizobium japonicum]MCS3996731.1 hypothetical protein [Bradyrhizobium japonicum]